MYFDEDGDLAHEFYEETIVTKNGRKKAKLKRIQKNLTPQVRNLQSLQQSFTHQRSFSVLSVQIIFIPFVSFQGIIKLDHPCIHVDFPVVLCEAWWCLRSVSDEPLCQLRPVVSPTAGSLNHLWK